MRLGSEASSESDSNESTAETALPFHDLSKRTRARYFKALTQKVRSKVNHRLLFNRLVQTSFGIEVQVLRRIPDPQDFALELATRISTELGCRVTWHYEYMFTLDWWSFDGGVRENSANGFRNWCVIKHNATRLSFVRYRNPFFEAKDRQKTLLQTMVKQVHKDTLKIISDGSMLEQPRIHWAVSDFVGLEIREIAEFQRALGNALVDELHCRVVWWRDFDYELDWSKGTKPKLRHGRGKLIKQWQAKKMARLESNLLRKKWETILSLNHIPVVSKDNQSELMNDFKKSVKEWANQQEPTLEALFGPNRFTVDKKNQLTVFVNRE